MKESHRYCLNEPKLKLINTLELNNSKSNMDMFEWNESLKSGDVSSVATTPEDFQFRRSSAESESEVFLPADCNKNERSNSCTSILENSSDKEYIEIFPNVPDQLLQEIGLFGEDTTTNQSNQEMEQKFVTLSLAFSIDSKTIKDRCERLRRHRDQTEKNLEVEIERLIERVNRLTKLCIDMESTELLGALLTQIDIVMKASALASSSAERYGAVQHEERLSEAVQLMLNYVNSLRHQRDLSRKQLLYTKKVLQGSNSQLSMQGKKILQHTQSDISATKRRASIASSSLQDQKKNDKLITRRTSELTFRTNATPKLSRPSRMELGLDLVNIKEGMLDETSFELSEPIVDDKPSGCDVDEENRKINENKNRPIFFKILSSVQDKAEITYRKWSEHGLLSNLFFVCSILCFCFAIIIMADILFELELSKG